MVSKYSWSNPATLSESAPSAAEGEGWTFRCWKISGFLDGDDLQKYHQMIQAAKHSLSHLLQKLLSWWFLQSFRTFSQSLGWAGIPPWGDDLQKDKLTLKLNWVKIPSKTREKRPTLELNWVKISIGDQVRLCYACIALCMAYPNQKDSASYLVGKKNELEKSLSRKIARFRRNSRVIPGFFFFSN